MDVLTAKRLLTMIFFFFITYFYGTWSGEGWKERTELPISWWHCVSPRFLVKFQIMSSQLSKSCDIFEVSLQNGLCVCIFKQWLTIRFTPQFRMTWFESGWTLPGQLWPWFVRLVKLSMMNLPVMRLQNQGAVSFGSVHCRWGSWCPTILLGTFTWPAKHLAVTFKLNHETVLNGYFSPRSWAGQRREDLCAGTRLSLGISQYRRRWRCTHRRPSCCGMDPVI